MNTLIFFVSSTRRSCLGRLDGILRHLTKHGWRVQVVERAFHKADVRETLKRWNPDGIIVECGSGAEELNRRAFGKLPVVYLDRDPKRCRNEMVVRLDSEGVGRTAAKELAQLLGRMVGSKPAKSGVHTFGAPCVIRRKSTRYVRKIAGVAKTGAVARGLDFIQTDAGMGVGVIDVVRKMGVIRCTAEVMFKAETGKTILRAINDRIYELAKAEFAKGWSPHLCWTLYKNPKNFPEILKATWIRPEDLHRYAGLVDVVKLATRQHANPDMVISAYERGSFEGNLLDLFEPGFSPAFFPRFIDNAAFPSDWFDRTSACPGDRADCGYCGRVFGEVLKWLSQEHEGGFVS